MSDFGVLSVPGDLYGEEEKESTIKYRESDPLRPSAQKEAQKQAGYAVVEETPPRDLTEEEALLRQIRRAEFEKRQALTPIIGEQPLDTSGSGAMDTSDATPAETARIREIIKAREKFGGAAGIGAIRTAADIFSGIVNTIVGVAQIPAVLMQEEKYEGFLAPKKEGLFTKPQETFGRKRYRDYFYKELENDPVLAPFKTLGKMWSEAPEIKDGVEFVESLINLDKKIITRREANTTSNYWRPEAGTFERLGRALPEFFLGYKIGKALETRGGKRQINRALDLAKNEAKNNPKRLKELDEKGVLAFRDTDEALGLLLTDVNRTFAKNYGKGFGAFLKQMRNVRQDSPIARYLIRGKIPFVGSKLQGVARRGLGERAAFNIGEARKAAQKQLDKAAGIKPTTSLRDRIRGIPKLKKTVALTEAGAALGLIGASRIFADNGDPGTVIGMGSAAVGSITAGLGYTATRNILKYGAETTGAAIFDIGAALRIDGFEKFAEKVDLDPRKTSVAKYFVLHLKSLPTEQRQIAVDNIMFFNELRKTLREQGVKDEFTHATVGKITGLVGVMQLTESLAGYVAQSQKALGGKGFGRQLDTLNEMLSQQTFQANAVKELREALDQISTVTQNVGSPKVTDFINALRRDVIKTETFIQEDARRFAKDLDKMISVVNNPSLSSAKSVEKIMELRSNLLKSPLLREAEGGIDRPELGARGLDEATRELATAARREISTLEKGARQEKKLLSGFREFFSPRNQSINREGAVDDFVLRAEQIKADRKDAASQMFEDIKGKRVDITDWFARLYESPVDLPTTTKQRVMQKLSNNRVVDSNTLAMFENIAVNDSIANFLKQNPEMFKHIEKAIGREDLGLNARNPNLTLQALHAYKRKEGASSIDLLFALKEIAQDNKVNTSALKVEVSTDFVIDTTSNLNRQASATSNLKQAEKLRVISDEMFISMKTLDQKDLERARKNYVNNVIMPYRQKDYNPLGFNIGDKLPNGDYATPASRWIDFNANLNGTVGDATDLIKHLKVTFGTYRNGNYVLEGSDKETIRNLLNNVLSKAISETGDVQSIKKSLKIPTKELGAQERRKVISGIDYIRSDFLDTLRKEGLLDLDQVVLYNRKISEVKGKSIKYKNAEKQLNQYKTAALRNASSQVRIREKALRDIAKALPEKQIIAGPELDQNIFNTFVSNAGALENSDEMIKRIAQGSDLSEGEVRDQVSRSIISHIEKQTMGRQIEIANSANEFTYDFDHRAFSSIIDQNRDALEKVMGDKFYSLEAISTLLRIQNRRVSDYLMEGGVSLSTAGGLSLESMVSRVYSISRGVVSPRYVATEIALLKLRQANLSIIKEILDDPKLTDDLIELVETEKFEIIERITPKLLPILVSTLAKYETVSKQERVKKQITEMEAKREKR